jgi:putative solute:sodium symporter small subunit
MNTAWKDLELDENAKESSASRHWRRNLQLVAILLSIWFVVSYGCGILWVESLNEYTLGGFPLGFFFAQQGSILVFIVLIAVYCVLMDRLDRKTRESEDEP